MQPPAQGDIRLVALQGVNSVSNCVRVNGLGTTCYTEVAKASVIVLACKLMDGPASSQHPHAKFWGRMVDLPTPSYHCDKLSINVNNHKGVHLLNTILSLGHTERSFRDTHIPFATQK